MIKYNNIKYTYKQAKRMLHDHKGKLQMGLPEWEEGDSIRLYYKPNITSAIYKAQRDINPQLPKDYYYLPDNLYMILETLGKYTEKHLGDLITEPYLYKHSVRGSAYVTNSIYNPTSKEVKRKDWILYNI